MCGEGIASLMMPLTVVACCACSPGLVTSGTTLTCSSLARQTNSTCSASTRLSVMPFVRWVAAHHLRAEGSHARLHTHVHRLTMRQSSSSSLPQVATSWTRSQLATLKGLVDLPTTTALSSPTTSTALSSSQTCSTSKRRRLAWCPSMHLLTLPPLCFQLPQQELGEAGP